MDTLAIGITAEPRQTTDPMGAAGGDDFGGRQVGGQVTIDEKTTRWYDLAYIGGEVFGDGGHHHVTLVAIVDVEFADMGFEFAV